MPSGLIPGAVVICAFPGAQVTKSRPAVVLSVVLSNEIYHSHRPDVIPGLITSRSPGSLSPTDREIRDWQHAGLRVPCYFRLYLVTMLQRDVRGIGKLSDFDWRNVRAKIQLGLFELNNQSNVRPFLQFK